jgi:hypothetical protein
MHARVASKTWTPGRQAAKGQAHKPGSLGPSRWSGFVDTKGGGVDDQENEPGTQRDEYYWGVVRVRLASVGSRERGRGATALASSSGREEGREGAPAPASFPAHAPRPPPQVQRVPRLPPLRGPPIRPCPAPRVLRGAADSPPSPPPRSPVAAPAAPLPLPLPLPHRARAGEGAGRRPMGPTRRPTESAPDWAQQSNGDEAQEHLPRNFATRSPRYKPSILTVRRQGGGVLAQAYATTAHASVTTAHTPSFRKPSPYAIRAWPRQVGRRRADAARLRRCGPGALLGCGVEERRRPRKRRCVASHARERDPLHIRCRSAPGSALGLLTAPGSMLPAHGTTHIHTPLHTSSDKKKPGVDSTRQQRHMVAAASDRRAGTAHLSQQPRHKRQSLPHHKNSPAREPPAVHNTLK